MASFSILHWIIFFMLLVVTASPFLGIVRGVRNGAVVHALLSYVIPVYGLVYFVVARRPRD